MGRRFLPRRNDHASAELAPPVKALRQRDIPHYLCRHVAGPLRVAVWRVPPELLTLNRLVTFVKFFRNAIVTLVELFLDARLDALPLYGLGATPCELATQPAQLHFGPASVRPSLVPARAREPGALHGDPGPCVAGGEVTARPG